MSDIFNQLVEDETDTVILAADISLQTTANDRQQTTLCQSRHHAYHDTVQYTMYRLTGTASRDNGAQTPELYSGNED